MGIEPRMQILGQIHFENWLAWKIEKSNVNEFMLLRT
jgi:hypothetical protein